jgi:hypothetical protein
MTGLTQPPDRRVHDWYVRGAVREELLRNELVFPSAYVRLNPVLLVGRDYNVHGRHIVIDPLLPVP